MAQQNPRFTLGTGAGIVALMRKHPLPVLLLVVMLAGAPAMAEPPTDLPGQQTESSPIDAPVAATPQDANLVDEAAHRASDLLNSGFQYLGIRYRFGGSTPQTGFDCSGLVRRVFMEALGLNLPRTAHEMAGLGKQINQSELKPGDLVFFNTMRRTFSHVGIYLGDNRFLHSPSSGGRVRVDNLSEDYWRKHFTGARRVVGESEGRAAIANPSLH